MSHGTKSYSTVANERTIKEKKKELNGIYRKTGPLMLGSKKERKNEL